VTRPSKSKHVAELWGVSATTFLLLAIWLGPHRAVVFISIALIIWGWVALCRRVPFVAAFTVFVLFDLLGGRRWR
jgi:hypothetical protein